MTTTYRVASTEGNLLGIFPKGELVAVKALVDANPGAEVKVAVSIANPCSAHAAYEADNCPSCGTDH